MMFLKLAHLCKQIYLWIFPYTCILCTQFSTRNQDLCETCYHELPFVKQACLRCARIVTQTNLLCEQCIKHPPSFDTCYALFTYQTPLPQLLMNLKFHACFINARLLGELFAEKIQQKRPLPEVIVPVPLHKKRLTERGFNQSLEIARTIASILKIPIDYTRCVRLKPTLAQAKLSAKNRQKNIQNAFYIKQPFPYQHIAVVDDIITTGHTMNAFCQTLKKAGVNRIDVWCIARPSCD